MTRPAGTLDEAPMHQDFVMEFPYRHSTGETIGTYARRREAILVGRKDVSVAGER